MENETLAGHEKTLVEQLVDQYVTQFQERIREFEELEGVKKLIRLNDFLDERIKEDRLTSINDFIDLSSSLFDGTERISTVNTSYNGRQLFLHDIKLRIEIILAWAIPKIGKKLYSDLSVHPKKLIRVTVDGRWSLTALNYFIQVFELIFQRLLSLDILIEYGLDTDFKLTSKKVIEDFDSSLSRLQHVEIRTIRYGSAGFFDLFGLGKIFEQINQIITKVILLKPSIEAAKWNLIEDKIESIVSVWEKVEKIDIDAKSKEKIRANLSKAIHQTVPLIKKGLITGSSMDFDDGELKELRQNRGSE